MRSPLTSPDTPLLSTSSHSPSSLSPVQDLPPLLQHLGTVCGVWTHSPDIHKAFSLALEVGCPDHCPECGDHPLQAVLNHRLAPHPDRSLHGSARCLQLDLAPVQRVSRDVEVGGLRTSP